MNTNIHEKALTNPFMHNQQHTRIQYLWSMNTLLREKSNTNIKECIGFVFVFIVDPAFHFVYKYII